MKIQLKNFNRFEQNRTKIIVFISIFMMLGLLFSYSSYEKYLFSFLLFSVSSYLLLIVGIFQNISFGIFLFNILLWIGFWLKNIIHLIFNYNYFEPIGNFDFSSQSFNDINLIISISFFSIIISIFLISMFNIQRNQVKENYFICQKIKFFLLLFIIIGMIVGLYLNNEFNILKLGSSVRLSELPWILRIIPSILMGVLIPIILYMLFSSELNNKKNSIYMFLLICFSTILISFSIQSRSVLFLLLMPIISYIAIHTDFFKKNKIILLFLGIFFFVIINVVNYLRDNNEVNDINKISQNFSRLLVDRWIGIEGLMAVYSYKNRDFNEFIKLSLEFREKQKLDYFTQNIAFGEKEKEIINSATEKSFASLPGPIAFLYLSNDLKLLFLGLFIIVLFIYLLEIILLNLTKNILLVYLFIFFLVFNLSSLGVDLLRSLRYIIFYYIMILLLVKIVDYLNLKYKGI